MRDDFHTTFRLPDYSDLELSTQILIREALRRGIQVGVLDRKEQFIQLKKGVHFEYVKKATMTSRDTLISYCIMENKAVTKAILQRNGIRVPRGRLISGIHEAESVYSEFSEKPVIVKPNTTNFGIGITFVPAHDEASFTDAVRFALAHDDTAIAEEFIEGTEYRFLVIDGRTVAVMHRIPANVIGDGTSTIRELIDRKNQDPKRGLDYSFPLIRIQAGIAEKTMLMSQGLDFDTVLETGHRVFLRSTSNISTGGDSLDATSEMPDVYKKMAVLATHTVGAKICGLDMIVFDKNASPNDTNHAVIELNFNPALHMHAFPFHGRGIDPSGAVLDLLGF